MRSAQLLVAARRADGARGRRLRRAGVTRPAVAVRFALAALIAGLAGATCAQDRAAGGATSGARPAPESAAPAAAAESR